MILQRQPSWVNRLRHAVLCGGVCFGVCVASPVLAHERSADYRIDRNVCGRVSLMCVLHFVSGKSYDLELQRLLPDERAPFSIAEIEVAARTLGFETRLVKWATPSQATFPCAAVVHVRTKTASANPDHFVACYGESAGGLCIGNFPAQPFVISRSQFNEFWSGYALYVHRPGSWAIRWTGPWLWLRLAALDAGVLLAAAVLMRSARRTRAAAGNASATSLREGNQPL